MRHAILITAYKNNNQLNNIVDSLSQNNFTFFIHIDKKSKITDDEVQALQQKENVRFAGKKYMINWGGINHLKSILFLLDYAFNNSDAEYFHLITGHDYPIRTGYEIDSFMEYHNNKEFLEYNKLPYKNWDNGGLERLTLYNPYDLIDGRSGWKEKAVKAFLKIQKKLGVKRKFPLNFPTLYGGSTYWTISRRCAAYIFTYMEEHPSYLKRFRYTFCSEEIFFQTIIMNSPLRKNVVNDSLRFIVWEKRNGNFPANLDETDYDNIKKSNALFARKFEFPVSAKLLDKIRNDLKSG